MKQFIVNSIIAISALLVIGFHIWLPEALIYTISFVGLYFISKVEFIPWKTIFYGSVVLVGVSFVFYLFFLSPVITLITISILLVFYFIYELLGSLLIKILLALLLLLIIGIIGFNFKQYPPMAIGVIVSTVLFFYVWCYTRIYERLNVHGFYFFIPILGRYALQSELNRSVLYKSITIVLVILTFASQIVITIISFSPIFIAIYLLSVSALIIINLYDLITIGNRIGFKQSFAFGLVFLFPIFIPILAMKKESLMPKTIG